MAPGIAYIYGRSPLGGLSPHLSAVLAAVGLAVAGAGGYALSLWLHPEHNCPRCKGQGKRYGTVFSWSRRQCTRCAGTGRRPRLGTVVWEQLLGQKPSRYRRP